MAKYLPEEDVSEERSIFVTHFFETLEALGGTTGLSILFIVLIAFYAFVHIAITYSRHQRDSKKRR